MSDFMSPEKSGQVITVPNTTERYLEAMTLEGSEIQAISQFGLAYIVTWKWSDYRKCPSEHQMRNGLYASQSVRFNIKWKTAFLLWLYFLAPSLEFDPRNSNRNTIIFYFSVTCKPDGRKNLSPKELYCGMRIRNDF
jgi:hypothetical protein